MSLSVEAIFVCIKQFKARLGDELSLQVGDRIEVLADDSEYNDGWYMGRNTETSAVGLFPKSFTKAEAPLETQDPSLLRSRSRRVPTGGSSGSGTSASKVPTVPAPKEPLAKSTTIGDIDKALKELQTTSLDPSKSHRNKAVKANLRGSSGQSLIHDLNPETVETWTPKQVSSYFAIALGFDMGIAGKFARHKITGEILLQLDLPHLKELEIDSFGTRFEIFKEIEKLRQISAKATPLLKPPPTTEAQGFSDALAPYNNSEDSIPNEGGNSSTRIRKLSKRYSLLPSADLKGPPITKSEGASRNTSVVSDSSKTHRRNRSHSVDDLQPGDILTSPNTTTFLSPRKAPEPPTQSPMITSYKFGGSPLASRGSNTQSPSPYTVRDKTASLGLLRPLSSVYDSQVNGHHRRGSSGLVPHQRHSSVFLFLSGNVDEHIIDSDRYHSQKRASKFFQDGDLTIIGDDMDIPDGSISPKKSKAVLNDKSGDSQGSPQGMLKSWRSVSTQNFRNLTVLKKLKTSAFTEGIREINPDEAIKTSNFSGWMSKKSGNSLGWRSRYFTLHGTRLSYYTSLRDRREKGLIDITAHKVLPISTESDSNTSNDKYIALYASLTGFGRYCFKLVPPAPGFKKGLTFTQPKTHYFAVETQDEMRGWLKALMTATIDIDDTVPVVSSCNTPTVTLAKAQELLTKAREETKLKDEELRSRGFVRIGETNDEATPVYSRNDSVSSGEPSPVIGSIDEATLSSSNTGVGAKVKQPKLTVDTQSKVYRTPSTPQPSISSGGFASPYLLASGLLSPKPNASSSPKLQIPSGSSTPHVSEESRNDYFNNMDDISSSKNTLGREDSDKGDRDRVTTPGSEHSKSADVPRKRSTSSKMMAYTSDGSFVIKSKMK